MCNCSAKKAGKLIAGFAGITALFSVIVRTVCSYHLRRTVVPPCMQMCETRVVRRWVDEFRMQVDAGVL